MSARAILLFLSSVVLGTHGESGIAAALDGHGMVTGTTNAPAIEAGTQVLREGGTAVDAALTTAMMQVCLAAGAWVSYAGIMTMMYYDRESNRVYNLNAGFNSVLGETDPQTIPGLDLAAISKSGLKAATATPSGRTALVPGFMAGVDSAHRRFGRLPLKRIFRPAVDCAERGFEWNTGLAQHFSFRRPVLERLPATRSIFIKKNGHPIAVGERFRQPELARTLRKAVRLGIRRYMYEGEWAEHLVHTVQAEGGKLTETDLRRYEVAWSEPLRGQYHDYEIYAHGLPADGGVNLIEAMNLADLVGLSSIGDYATSPQALFWLAQISKPAIMLAVLGEPGRTALSAELGTTLSPLSRLDKGTSRVLLDSLRSGRFPMGVTPPKPAPVHTDAVVSVDRWGNVAAVLHSINTISWGSTGIFVDGISIPDAAAFQQPLLAQLKPGSRVPDQSSPGIVMKDGKPVLGFSAIGAGLHSRTVTALINVLDQKLSPQEAIGRPSVGMFRLDPSAWASSPLTVGKGEFSPAVLDAVRAMGQPVAEDDSLRGYWIGIAIDPATGQLSGGAPVTRSLSASPGRAVGY